MSNVTELLSTLRQRDVKLWLDGDKLRYRSAKDALCPDLLAQLKSQKPEIISFLKSISAETTTVIPPLVKIQQTANIPLSFGQQRLWFLHQFEPNSSVNNVPVVVRFTGVLNIAALHESLRTVVSRHEVLRTTFPVVDGKPIQAIDPNFTISLPIFDIQHFPPAQREVEALRLATQEAHQPFDLATGPILRVHLMCLSAQEHLLIWNMHNIVCDGASADLFYQEIVACYRAFSVGAMPELLPLAIQYTDFAQWQRQWLQGEVLDSQVNYWKQKLGGSLPTIQLPFDRPRPSGVTTYPGDRAALMLPKPLGVALTNLSQKWGGTLFMTLLSAFNLLLHRYSGQEDLLMSFASTGRGRAEMERTIGFFSNTLLLRTQVQGNLTFRELFDLVRTDCIAAYSHQDVPFEKLVEELKPEQRQDRSPLFQVKFALNPSWANGQGMSEVELPDLTIKSLFGYIYHGQTKYDLILVMREQNEGLGMVFDYNAEMFEAKTIKRMLGHFQTLLESIVANPDRPISQLPLLSAPEQQQLLAWNDTQAEYPTQAVHQLFEAQAERTPDEIAVEFEGKQLTYRELNARSNQLARQLKDLGVGADVPVGICIERSLPMVVGILGILKAGGAYVPLDPAYPQARLAYLLENSQIGLLLASQQTIAGLPSHQSVVVDLDTDWAKISQQSPENLGLAVQPAQLSYIIYTSGSTGLPKGVSMTHRAISNLISWQINQPRAKDRPTTIQFAPISFDVSCQEMFATWCAGGRLILISEELRRDPLALLQLLDTEAVERVFLPFMALQQLAEVAVSAKLFPASLVDIITAGEQLRITPAINKFCSKLVNCALHNHYGPTESHVVTSFTLTGPVRAWPSLPSIGKPITNTQIYILSPDLQPVPIGIAGELYIGGDCLARGYFNRPDLTRERFIPNPVRGTEHSSPLLYKTGDLARYRPDGQIEYLGRIDNQVKIRGFRIELGEIETLLAQHPAILQTTVTVREDIPGDRRLVAYCVVDLDAPPKINQLRDFIAQKVPNYMVPATFVMLCALPINPNGKIDQRALPAPDYTREESEEDFIPPRNEIERKLTNIWQSLLGIETIGVKDNFFELGGHSLIAVRLFSEIEQTWGKNLPLATLFQAQTIEALAGVLIQKTSPARWSALVPIQPNGSRTPLFCVHAVWGNVLYYKDLVSHLHKDQPFYGLQAQGLDGSKAPSTSVPEMAANYIKEILTVQPHGPYSIGGSSFGGLVAFEIAKQLHQRGEKIAFLGVIDTATPNLSPSDADVANSTPRFSNHIQQFLKLGVSEKYEYVWNRVYWHLTGGKASIFYRLYLQYISKSPGNLRLLDVALANRQARDSYIPTPAPIPLTLFRAQIQRPEELNLPHDFGWSDFATGKVEVYEVGGSHESMMQAPQVQSLAKQVNICLEQAQSSGGGD